MASVTVDSNSGETPLFEALKAAGVDASRAKLDAGDILIRCGESKFLIERNSLQEFASRCPARLSPHTRTH